MSKSSRTSDAFAYQNSTLHAMGSPKQPPLPQSHAYCNCSPSFLSSQGLQPSDCASIKFRPSIKLRVCRGRGQSNSYAMVHPPCCQTLPPALVPLFTFINLLTTAQDALNSESVAYKLVLFDNATSAAKSLFALPGFRTATPLRRITIRRMQ